MNAEERQRLIDGRRVRDENQRRKRLNVLGEWRFFDVWRVPVAGLLLNIDNRRFRAERQLIEESLGHSPRS